MKPHKTRESWLKMTSPPQKSIFGHFWRSHTMSLLPVSQTWFLQRVSLKKVRSLGRPRNENCSKNAKRATFCCTILFFLGPQSAENVVFQNSLAKLVEKYLWTSEVRKMMTQNFWEKKDHGLAYISFSSILVEGERSKVTHDLKTSLIQFWNLK